MKIRYLPVVESSLEFKKFRIFLRSIGVFEKGTLEINWFDGELMHQFNITYKAFVGRTFDNGFQEYGNFKEAIEEIKQVMGY